MKTNWAEALVMLRGYVTMPQDNGARQRFEDLFFEKIEPHLGQMRRQLATLGIAVKYQGRERVLQATPEQVQFLDHRMRDRIRRAMPLYDGTLTAQEFVNIQALRAIDAALYPQDSLFNGAAPQKSTPQVGSEDVQPQPNHTAANRQEKDQLVQLIYNMRSATGVTWNTLGEHFAAHWGYRHASSATAYLQSTMPATIRNLAPQAATAPYFTLTQRLADYVQGVGANEQREVVQALLQRIRPGAQLAESTIEPLQKDRTFTKVRSHLIGAGF